MRMVGSSRVCVDGGARREEYSFLRRGGCGVISGGVGGEPVMGRSFGVTIEVVELGCDSIKQALKVCW